MGSEMCIRDSAPMDEPEDDLGHMGTDDALYEGETELSHNWDGWTCCGPDATDPPWADHPELIGITLKGCLIRLYQHPTTNRRYQPPPPKRHQQTHPKRTSSTSSGLADGPIVAVPGSPQTIVRRRVCRFLAQPQTRQALPLKQPVCFQNRRQLAAIRVLLRKHIRSRSNRLYQPQVQTNRLNTPASMMPSA